MLWITHCNVIIVYATTLRRYPSLSTNILFTVRRPKLRTMILRLVLLHNTVPSSILVVYIGYRLWYFWEFYIPLVMSLLWCRNCLRWYCHIRRMWIDIAVFNSH